MAAWRVTPRGSADEAPVGSVASQGEDVLEFVVLGAGVGVSADRFEGVDGVAGEGGVEQLVGVHRAVSGVQVSMINAISASGRWWP